MLKNIQSRVTFRLPIPGIRHDAEDTHQDYGSPGLSEPAGGSGCDSQGVAGSTDRLQSPNLFLMTEHWSAVECYRKANQCLVPRTVANDLPALEHAVCLAMLEPSLAAAGPPSENSPELKIISVPPE